ncbi:MAG: phosphatidylcholine synthase [Rhodobacterales bacterium]|nr:MAG: phosphatidylcholine synthase [Rhodobacterales bacterium]
MSNKHPAILVHWFTALGAICAMMAMLAAANANWSTMFLWLVAAFIVDGLDGPMARKLDVKQNAPEIDGALMDLIIDYLTYVFIPAYALFKSGLLPGWSGWLAILAIVFTSVVYYSDTRMKTKDNSFSGFPGCWNMVIIVLFATTPPPWFSLTILLGLAIAMFLPLKFIHPARTERWRAVSMPIAMAWTFFAGWAAWVDFDPTSWAHWGLVLTSAYLLFAGILQQVVPQKVA